MGTRHSIAAFTLVELLVSMTVLVLLVAGVAAMVNAVSSTTTAGHQLLSSDNEARKVFDRMASDFAKMVKRADADTVFASIKGSGSSGANDKMFFYSEAPAFYDTTGMAGPTPAQSTAGLIGYRIHNEATAGAAPDLQLERLGKGLTWDMPTAASTPGAVVFLTYPAASPSPNPSPTPFASSTSAGVSTAPGSWTGTGAWSKTIGTSPDFDDGVDADYHVLSADVFRLEFCFVLKSNSQYTTSLTQGQGFSNVSAIIVGIALLDAQTRVLVPAGVSMNGLAAALPDPDFTVNPPKLMAESWAAVINASGAAATLGVPKAVVSQMRVYQRTFYLNTP
jgi:type II secretory pathway component PulJ